MLQPMSYTVFVFTGLFTITMIPVNRTVKIIVSSGSLLIVVWLAILAFGAASFESKDSGNYYPSSKQV